MAHKNSLLTKRREPKPTNSACAEFANQKAGSISGKTFQSENRQTILRIRLRRILELLHRAVAKTGVTRCKSGKPANYRKKQRFLQLLCLCREKRCLFGKSKLQRRQKRSSVPQKTGITIPRIRHKPNSCAFVSLQGKTLFIWQIKVAKTAKTKLCAAKARHRGSRDALAPIKP